MSNIFEEDSQVIRERLAAIVRSAADAILSEDTSGIVRSWNRAAERLYGYSETEILGRPISVLVPSDRAGEEHEILRRILRGDAINHYETRRVTRDGRVIDVSISASPIHNSQGEIVGASVSARAVEGSETIRSLADRLAAIVQGSDDAIYSKDANAIVDSWNPGAERLYGYTAQEAIGRHIGFIVPPHRRGEETEILNRILAGERIDHYETQRVAKFGQVLDVSISVSPIRNGLDQIVGASVIARDIGDRTRVEELQRRVDRTEFIARATHELRTPVATILGFAGILNHPRASDDQREQAVDAIVRQAERVQMLITDLLDLSYLESGRYEMNIRPVAVAEVVDDTLETAPPPEDKSVEIAIRGDFDVLADPARLAQVLVNLFTNAYKYGGDQIGVSARPEGDRVVIEVSDDGPGVPASVRTALFEPFVRGHTGIPGTGLGLALSARLVEAQDGEISLVPTAAGTRFAIRLPRPAAVGPRESGS